MLMVFFISRTIFISRIVLTNVQYTNIYYKYMININVQSNQAKLFTNLQTITILLTGNKKKKRPKRHSTRNIINLWYRVKREKYSNIKILENH